MIKKILSFFVMILLISTTLIGCSKENAEIFTVSFNTNGGTAIADIKVKEGNFIDDENLLTTKDGKEFGGWYLDEELTQPWNMETSKVKKDITLYAKWEAPKPSLEYDTSGLVTETLSTDILAAITADKSLIVFAGSPSCGTCAAFKPLLNQFIAEYNTKIYYFNGEESDSADKNELKYLLGATGTPPILMYPQLFAFVDGQLVGITGSSTNYNDIVEFANTYYNIG